MSPIDLKTYRRRAEEFVSAIAKEYYLHYSGLKEVCDFTAIYDRFPELFTREAVMDLESRYPNAKDEPKRRLAYLISFAVEAYLGEQTKRLSDDIANTETQASIEVDGEAIPFRYSSVVQANEADGERRARIQKAREVVLEDVLNPRYDELWRTSHDLARDLGYPDYMELFSTVKGQDYRFLQAQTDAFLRDTQSIYERSLHKLVMAKLGVPLAGLRYSDLPYLWRAPEYDAAFSVERFTPTLQATLAGLGIDLAGQSNVTVDAEPRELKSPRAFCSPVHVPDEIYLVVMPKGGQDDYGALLHEAGHTEHFAHADRTLPFEYRHLGDNAVTEGFAFVFDHLLLNPQWLARYLDFTDSADYLQFANISELYYLRRYAAKLAYEIELHTHTGSLDGLAERYRAIVGEAVMIDVPAAYYLADVDDAFYCASYLRAWMLEGALRMMLQDRYGMEWFRSEKAAAWLRELWAHGQHWPAERLLLKYGGGKLDHDPLRHHIERALGR